MDLLKPDLGKLVYLALGYLVLGKVVGLVRGKLGSLGS